MSQPKKTEAIKRFLEARTHPDLAHLYNPCMEVQVWVEPDGGERVEGEFKGRQFQAYSDGIQTWKNIRIPLHANTPTPVDNDGPMNWDLVEHAAGIGMTGWDYKNKVSKWVGFDFDAMVGHSELHTKKLTQQELWEVQQAAEGVEWVTVRRSTSGKGIHLYVFVPEIPTETHTEHMALGKAILSMLSGRVGFDFHLKADACGGNMWVWHRKMLGTNGLELIKQGGTLYEVPANWKDYVPVMENKRRKVLPGMIAESDNPDAERLFDELTGQASRIPLDEEHKRLIAWLQDNGHRADWIADHHMLITHTYGLLQAHEALNLKGIFRTQAQGAEKGDHNAFAFPIRKGAWAIRRYTPGVKEDDSWEQDGAGWTRTFYNKEPDLSSACRSNSGKEHPSGGFHFTLAEQAQTAALSLGTHLSLPGWALGRSAKLKAGKSGKLIAEINYEAKDNPGDMPDWIQEGKTWKRVFNTNVAGPTNMDTGNYDDIVRHLVTETNEDYGWVILADGAWQYEPLKHIEMSLTNIGVEPKAIKHILGGSIQRPWMIVNKPFEPEYPGDRQWNRGAAQFKFVPNPNRDALHYPTWMSILTHVGNNLNEAIAENAWCKANGIKTGADYLKCWIASLFQEPRQPLPYLFLYSQEQNTGKSMFHEALSLLVTKGIERADNALTSQQAFNGELKHAVVCVVEETNLNRSKTAYNRIKDWVTSPMIPIHEKYGTPYPVPNTTHWVQTANDHSYCPIFPGDTRITMIRVSPLEPEQLIPKKHLIPKLEKEAPDFLAEMLHLEIPHSNDRLNVPVIATEEKAQAQLRNRTPLQVYIDEKCFYVPGETIKYSDFYEKFKETLDPNDHAEWSKIRVGRELPPEYPKGRAQDGQFYIGNISWRKPNPGDPKKPKLRCVGASDMLKPVGSSEN